MNKTSFLRQCLIDGIITVNTVKSIFPIAIDWKRLWKRPELMKFIKDFFDSEIELLEFKPDMIAAVEEDGGLICRIVNPKLLTIGFNMKENDTLRTQDNLKGKEVVQIFGFMKQSKNFVIVESKISKISGVCRSGGLAFIDFSKEGVGGVRSAISFKYDIAGLLRGDTELREKTGIPVNTAKKMMEFNPMAKGGWDGKVSVFPPDKRKIWEKERYLSKNKDLRVSPS